MFPYLVFKRAHAAVLFFSRSREAAAPTRFNKASLLSWLVFLSRFYDFREPDFGAVQIYIKASKGEYISHFISEATSLFDDRASLRVTDVSSVVYRDFVLCYVYHFAIAAELPPAVDIFQIEAVEDILRQGGDSSFEEARSQVVDVESWSRTL